MPAEPKRNTAIKNARVSIARLSSYGPEDVGRAVEAVLEPLGGMSAFVRPGDRVVLKPNFLRPSRPERAVATHPEIIRRVGRLVRACGISEPVVTDSCGLGTARRCAQRLGLTRDDEPFTVHDADDGFDAAASDYHRLKLSRRMVDADVLINLAKVKTHAQMVITGAVKNTFGAVVGLEKVQWHMRAGRDPMDFAELLLHIHSTIAPALNIVDGVVGMEGNGPGSGTPRALGVLLASDNAHVLDFTLCRILRIDPDKVFTLRAAKKRGLLPPEDHIEVLGEALEKVRLAKRWQLARPLVPNVMGGTALAPMIERMISLKPHIHNATCTACGECVSLCAPKAMSMSKERSKAKVVIDRDQCISCFCCQEMCPSGAITVKAGWLARLMGLGIRSK